MSRDALDDAQGNPGVRHLGEGGAPEAVGAVAGQAQAVARLPERLVAGLPGDRAAAAARERLERIILQEAIALRAG